MIYRVVQKSINQGVPMMKRHRLQKLKDKLPRDIKSINNRNENIMVYNNDIAMLEPTLDDWMNQTNRRRKIQKPRQTKQVQGQQTHLVAVRRHQQKNGKTQKKKTKLTTQPLIIEGCKKLRLKINI